MNENAIMTQPIFPEGEEGGEEEKGLFAFFSRFLKNLKKIEILERGRLKTSSLTKPPRFPIF